MGPTDETQVDSLQNVTDISEFKFVAFVSNFMAIQRAPVPVPDSL
jgi:hypothetical protein